MNRMDIPLLVILLLLATTLACWAFGLFVWPFGLLVLLSLLVARLIMLYGRGKP